MSIGNSLETFIMDIGLHCQKWLRSNGQKFFGVLQLDLSASLFLWMHRKTRQIRKMRLSYLWSKFSILAFPSCPRCDLTCASLGSVETPDFGIAYLFMAVAPPMCLKSPVFCNSRGETCTWSQECSPSLVFSSCQPSFHPNFQASTGFRCWGSNISPTFLGPSLAIVVWESSDRYQRSA